MTVCSESRSWARWARRSVKEPPVKLFECEREEIPEKDEDVGREGPLVEAETGEGVRLGYG